MKLSMVISAYKCSTYSIINFEYLYQPFFQLSLATTFTHSLQVCNYFLINRLFFFLEQFSIAEKLSKMYRGPYILSPLPTTLPPPEIPLLLTSCFNVVHLLQLINQYYIFLTKIHHLQQSSPFELYRLWVFTNV